MWHLYLKIEAKINFLSIFEKIIENLIQIRLCNYVVKYKIISNTQFGLRKTLFSENAITHLIISYFLNFRDANKCIASSVFTSIHRWIDNSILRIYVFNRFKVEEILSGVYVETDNVIKIFKNVWIFWKENHCSARASIAVVEEDFYFRSTS